MKRKPAFAPARSPGLAWSTSATPAPMLSVLPCSVLASPAVHRYTSTEWRHNHGGSGMAFRIPFVAAATAVTLLAHTGAADAACTRLGFSVNDYGKDGPTKDAQDLLDKYIAQWTAERGIKKYTAGKKSVSCELFLDFIVFDEHTCKAEATVCWTGNPPAATN